MTIFKIILLHFWKFKWLILVLGLVFFGFASAFSQFSETDTFESETLGITVVDESDSEVADALIDYLNVNHDVAVSEINDREALEEQVFLMEIHGALVIDEHIEDKIRHGAPVADIISDTRLASSIQLENEVNKFLVFANAQYNEFGELRADDLQTVLSNPIDVELNDNDLIASEENFAGVRSYANFAAYWLMLFIMLTVGNLMSEYNKPELQNRITVTPLTSTSNALQTIGAQSIVGLFVVCIMFSGMLFLFRGRLEGIPLDKIFIALILITLFTLSLQYAINAMTINRFIVNGLANFLTIGLAFLSGIFIPIEMLGSTTKRIAEFLPLYHYTQIYAESDITWAGALPSIGILLLYTAAFLVIGVILNNQRKSTQL